MKEALTVKKRWGSRPVVNTFVKNAMKEQHELHFIIAGFEQTAAGIEEVQKWISGVALSRSSRASGPGRCQILIGFNPGSDRKPSSRCRVALSGR
jgi:hypothetical protein